MANIIRVANIIKKNQSEDLTQQHQFLNTIISHLQYLFGAIIAKAETPSFQAKESNSPQPIDNGVSQLNQNISNNEQYEENLNDIEQVPSIEEISNFEDNEQSQQKFKVNKKKTKRKIMKKLTKKRMNKLYQNTKKPVSSFVYFYKDRLKQIKSANGSRQMIPIGNLAKILSAEWRRLGMSEKQPYIDMAQKSLKQYYLDKEKVHEEIYLKELQKGENENIMDETLNKAQEIIPKDYDLPCNPPFLSSFLMYFNAHSERISRQTGQTKRSKLAKIVSEEWRHLPLAERKKYQNNPKKQEQNISINDEEKDIVPKQYKKYKKYCQRQEEEYLPIAKLKSKRIIKKNRFYLPPNEQLQQMAIENNKERNLPLNQEKLIDSQSRLNFIQNGNFQQKYQQEEDQQQEEKDAEDFNKYTIIQLNSNDQDASHQLSQSFSNDQAKLLGSRRGKDKKIRGPISAFLLYYQENVKDLMLQNIKGQGSDLVKLASAYWAKLPQEHKQIYRQKAKASRQVYQREVELFHIHKKVNLRKPRRDKQDQA